MNPIQKILIACSCAALLTGCKKDDPEPDNNLSYKVDGILKTAKPEGTYFTSDNSIMIDGTKGNEDITIFIDTVVTPGVYTMGEMGNNIAAMYVNWDNSIIYTSTSGTITIDSYNGQQISGSFQFNVKAGHLIKNISEGKFTAKLEVSSGYTDIPPDCPDSTYEVMKRNQLLHLPGYKIIPPGT